METTVPIFTVYTDEAQGRFGLLAASGESTALLFSDAVAAQELAEYLERAQLAACHLQCVAEDLLSAVRDTACTQCRARLITGQELRQALLR